MAHGITFEAIDLSKQAHRTQASDFEVLHLNMMWETLH